MLIYFKVSKVFKSSAANICMYLPIIIKYVLIVKIYNAQKLKNKAFNLIFSS